MTIGDRIKYYRAKYDITSRQLSELTGIHDTNSESGNLTELMLQFKKQKYFEKLLEWEQFRYTLNELDKSVENDDNEIADIRIKILSAIEYLELDMQSTPYLLTNPNGRISIRNSLVINMERKKPSTPIDQAYSILEKIKITLTVFMLQSGFCLFSEFVHIVQNSLYTTLCIK